jgi:hypothetical protein
MTLESYRALVVETLAAGPPESLHLICKSCGKQVGGVLASEPWPVYVSAARASGRFFGPDGRVRVVGEQFRVLLGHSFRHPDVRCVARCYSHGFAMLEPDALLQWTRTAMEGGSPVRRVRCGTVGVDNVWPQSIATEA